MEILRFVSALRDVFVIDSLEFAKESSFRNEIFDNLFCNFQ
ncbi:hypothetical protein LEP1GSC163_3455 [Leptospira santarosai str. CBC379]|uniref:Uncharacterized protein n=1 Tax=Leptospira santarosai str. MOR084 TaxID=1049984 RepID=A0A0E2BCM5_9LEPT|nr:hypothetical protein LEP1GSC179_3781 [Leptospira santarosai str. MOR084]EKR91222.1 hypothetical protein LEP1GSC163_3455 [Leptospira santarosai str. CBC379]